MPAGALLTADWQVEIRGVLTGFGTAFHIGEGYIQGLYDVPAAKTSDVPLEHDAGAYLGRDYTGPRIITVAYALAAATAAATANNLATLTAAWATSEVDLDVHIQAPGIGHKHVWGRPRGVVVDVTSLYLGMAGALATLVCGNPAILAP
jgi:hypothetical protein